MPASAAAALIASVRRQRDRLLAGVQRVGLAVPKQFAGDAVRQRNSRVHGIRVSREFNIDWSGRMRFGSLHMLQSAEVRLDRNRGESGLRRTDACDDAQQIVVWMGAPRVRIGARGLWLLGPGRESERNHGAPRAEEIEIAIAETGVLDGARE